MPAKVTKKITLKELPKDALRYFRKNELEEIIVIIGEQIQKGLSPVTGQNSYPAYAKATQKLKRRAKPVDLTDSGKMLSDLTAKNAPRGVEFFFKTKRSDRIAGYHNEGTKKMKKRMILPSKKGQTFKKKITNEIVKIANRAVSLATKKQNS